jgi:Ser/Thr protein kinase RdoA (MazF antagonist)
MGIKTHLALEEANRLFDDYRFQSIHPTVNGIIDTTYIAHSDGEKYILKRYEEASAEQIEAEASFLRHLSRCRFNVPARLDSAKGWHLYTLLKGEILTSVRSSHLQTLARTLAFMHRCGAGRQSPTRVFQPQKTDQALRGIKPRNFPLYKQLSPLRHYRPGNDGIIHADLFLDNVLFEKQHIGIIDFIDAGEGSFAFDLGVTASIWATRGASRGRLRLFLKNYNQHAPKKIALQKLLESMQTAAQFYTLSRLHKNAGTYRQQTRLMRTLKTVKRGGEW